MAGVMVVNDVDVEDTLGLHLISLNGWSSAVTQRRPFTAVPGWPGGISPILAVADPREIEWAGLINPDTVIERDALLNNIMGVLHGKPLRIQFSDAPTKYVDGVLESADVQGRDPTQSFVQPWQVVTLTFVCKDGAKYSTTTSTVVFGSSDTAIPLGTLVTGGIVTIEGPATNPVITYKSSAGETLGEMAFTLELDSGDQLRLDVGRLTVKKVIDSVESNALDDLTSADWFRPAHTDGDYLTADWPTIAVSSGSGSYTYRKAWAT